MRTRTLLLSILGALTLLGLAIPASAAAGTGTPAGAGTPAVTTHLVAGSAASRAAVTALWTPERMRAAVARSNTTAMQVPTSLAERAERAGSAGSAPKNTGPATILATPTAASSTGLRPNVLPSPNLPTPAAQGEVFFYDPADDTYSACSGGTVNNPTGDMVVTAGHCIYDTAWMQDWVYAPAYNNGSEPYGLFFATAFNTFTTWINGADHNYDVGIANVGLNALSQKLVPTTGANGFGYNGAYSVVVTIWGYPYDSTNNENGNTPLSCYNVTTRQYISRVEATCAMEGGASGGPWLSSYNVSSRLGYIDGVTSTGDPLGDIDSPYFSSNEAALYNNSANQ
jgi:V8-like Glu-specific endopeptidase